MALDAYTLCPCGTGKKIKFCCPDLLGELQELHRMIEGDQYAAALKHIEGLEAKHPDRASLLTTRVQLLRGMDHVEEAKKVAGRFVEKHPDNPIALAEMAITTALVEGGRQAMAWFQKAMAASREQIYFQVYEAMGILAQVLASEGEMRAARALVRLQLSLAPDHKDDDAMNLLLKLNSSSDVPLLIKEERPLATCPDDVPWKARFDEAIFFVRSGLWKEAETRLESLAEEINDSPAIWQALAMLRGWLSENDGSIEAWRKYAALEVPLEDAVEAEALAMLLSDDPLGDSMDFQMLTYPVDDLERVQTALIASPRAVGEENMPVSVGEDDVPPKATYLLVNRVVPESAEELTLETIPCVLGQVLLFGKQTDREARLEVVGVTAEDAAEVETLLRDLAGDALGAEVQHETLTQTSVTQHRLRRPWHLPSDTSEEHYQKWAEAHRDHVLLETWPRTGLGVLDGQSPEEAASQEAYRVRVLAAILVLDYWSGEANIQFDFNRLRERLGLPTLGPLAPGETPIVKFPLIRLHRLEVEKLSDDDVLNGFRRSILYDATEALLRFARELTQRASFNGQAYQLHAYELLVRLEEDLDKTLEYLERGRDAAATAGESSANWDLIELNIRMQRGEVDRAQRLLQHLQAEHLNEPGVAQALMQFFVQIGMIHPDGTPAGPMPEEEVGAVATGQTSDAPGKLWTPESQQPGQKKTIWTPGD